MGHILLIILISLVGCSTDGADNYALPTVPEQGTPISFSSGLQEEREVSAGGTGANSMTRATGLETVLTDKSFKVWGFKNDAVTGTDYTSYQTVFPGFTVNWTANTAHTTTSNTHDWEYVGVTANQTIKYWDFGAKAYRYFAVAPATATVTVPTPGATPVVQTISATVDASTTDGITAAPYFSRLWFKNSSALTAMTGQPVTLEFLKPFARVRFMFTFADGLNVDRDMLSNPSFKPETGTIATAGTVTVTYPLTGVATSESWSISNPTGIEKFSEDYTDDNQKWYTVLPQSLGAFTVSVVVSNLVSTATVPAEYMNWKAGYEYTYKFKILEGGGLTLDVLQVAINDWVEKKDIDHEVYNW